jgi:short subunit dehydrogenase-like uncharacterized protein
MTSERQYDIVLFGATGYTGKYTAKHLIENAPDGLRWAVAGRSLKKLESLLYDLQPTKKPCKLPTLLIRF